jgi:hypothetical protein
MPANDLDYRPHGTVRYRLKGIDKEPVENSKNATLQGISLALRDQAAQRDQPQKKAAFFIVFYFYRVLFW